MCRIPAPNQSHETSSEEMAMKSISGFKIILVSVLAVSLFVLGCSKSPEGKYRDPSGQMNAEFKDGKAYIAMGGYAVHGTYKIEGDKIIASGNFGLMIPSPLVFTVNKDGSIDGPDNTFIPRLERVKD